jgi:hypothetical protein
MTDELDQAAIGEPEAAEAFGGEVSEFDSADASVSASSIKVLGVTLEDAEDAAEWAWRHTLGHKKDVEPGGISLDIEEHEETSTRSSSVSQDDPPPPPPPAEHPAQPAHHAPEHHAPEHTQHPAGSSTETP